MVREGNSRDRCGCAAPSRAAVPAMAAQKGEERAPDLGGGRGVRTARGRARAGARARGCPWRGMWPWKRSKSRDTCCSRRRRGEEISELAAIHRSIDLLMPRYVGASPKISRGFPRLNNAAEGAIHRGPRRPPLPPLHLGMMLCRP